MTFTPEPWEAPAPGHWRRDFRIAEWLPAPMSPSFETWLLPLLEEGYRDASAQAFGFRLGERLHVSVNGWYFTNEGSVDGLLRTLARRPRKMLSQGIALATFPTRPERAREALARPGQQFHDAVVLPQLREASAAADRCMADDPVGAIDRLGRASGALLLTMITTVGYASKAEFALARFLRTHLPEDQRVSHLALLAGVVCPTGPQAHDVVSLDWIEPTFGEWAADPAPAASPTKERHEQLRIDAGLETDRCRALLPESRRARFDELVAIAREAIVDREARAGEMTGAWPELRRTMASIGATLASAGVVADAADVYFLERDEILAGINGQANSLAVEVDERRVRREAQRRLAAPLALGEPAGPWKNETTIVASLRHPLAPGADPLVQGVPTSAGTAEGPVRIVRGLEDFADLAPGEVLVAPVTAPAWTPLFALAAAVVTDGGSAFSHTSVVAREYAIPAVVGTGDATTTLRTGDHVRVDGHTGAVTLVEARR